jgi:hypothetical protein
MTGPEKLYRTDYIAFFPDGSTRSGFVQWPRNPGLALIEQLVLPLLGDGEPLEQVAVLYKDRPADMFVSEYGHLDHGTRGPLPRNDAATDIYRAHWRGNHPNDDPDTLPWIAGPAVLFTNRIVWT